eukprot:CAMPEP_0176016026 /NCGR_PEP_ID=MMETSP0120_2-20121206/7638_1 /TAXON_ID=160619 /ORGANISM="Kryptoperidinium foliaceum, Strain CCMP 1326" /LENGTH=91 /DNA_ID=CAMNT_0017349009 /DNA_START=58 /DNA_END=329 /DNA_ORIENTATION=-
MANIPPRPIASINALDILQMLFEKKCSQRQISRTQIPRKTASFLRTCHHENPDGEALAAARPASNANARFPSALLGSLCPAPPTAPSPVAA